MRMCGIFGYVGDRNASQILMQGLKDLEYRGYDSWGIAIANNGTINVIKRKGEISKAEDLCLEGRIGIAHTRWATHGVPSDINAHPHISYDGALAIVHNGIITNFEALRERLLKEEYKFSSDTDSEVLVNLIHSKMNDVGLLEATQAALTEVEGSYAIAVLSANHDYVVLAKKESPFLIGVGNDEMFFASDIMPMLDYTKKVITLHDGDTAVLTQNSFEVFNSDSKVTRSATSVPWSKKEAELGNFAHYMQKEIHEQERTIQEALRQPAETLEAICSSLKNAERIFITAEGTSLNAGMVFDLLLSEKGYMTKCLRASELRHHKNQITQDSVVVAVSQSGETADLISALKDIKEKNPKVVSILNRVGSHVEQLSDHVIYIKAGPEIGVASTKAYTGQIAVMYLLAGNLNGSLDETRSLLLSTAEKVHNILAESESEISRIVEELKGQRDFYFIGKGINHATALEAALKLKEISYIHAEGFAGGELKHGPLALIEKGVPVVVIAPKDSTYQDIISNAHEAKTRGAAIIGVSSETHTLFDYFVKIPENHSTIYPITSVVPLQYLAYKMAVALGKNPDKPRNLAKSVTVK
ncbi:glutamine--fructose-6-phosphate transaminase (isomerizing) [Candidatus Woesearchaeota archaeon]|nr:MAG: glutamine--fructose-6-phosphate transaminase (isomerizing) [Candidatus Woesearchaeota archaeon]